MKNMKRFILLLGVACLLSAVAMVGCQKEGPLEKAGKKADEVIEDAKKAIAD